MFGFALSTESGPSKGPQRVDTGLSSGPKNFKLRRYQCARAGVARPPRTPARRLQPGAVPYRVPAPPAPPRDRRAPIRDGARTPVGQR